MSEIRTFVLENRTKNFVWLSISDVWDQTEQIGTKPAPNRFETGFVFDKLNDFVQIPDSAEI